jgi:hypothetical protein
MSWLDLVTIMAGAAAGWVGARLGATRISAAVSLPASLGIAYGSHGLVALVVQPLIGLSMRTSQPIAFALVLLLSLGALHQVAKRRHMDVQTKLDRYAGLALGVWSALIAGAIATVFMSNYPTGRAVVNESWLWHLLNAMRIV